MRILCAGLATVDLVQRVDRFPAPDEKVQSTSVEVAAGGPATNAAITAALLGAEVTLLTAVGRHPLGELLEQDLRRYGVRLADAAPDTAEPPPLSAVVVHAGTGERTVVSRNASRPAVPPGGLGEADVVLVDGHHPALALAAADAAPLLVVDAGSWRPAFAEILPRADVVACSATFRTPDGGLPRAPHVAVTHGPGPVRWWSGERHGTIPVPPVEAVDTTGAGDVFHGALTVATARGDGFEEALRYAVGVAGIRVAHAGPHDWRAALRA